MITNAQLMCCTHSQDMCSLMERINTASGTERKKRFLKSFIDQWRETHNKLHTTQAATTVSQWVIEESDQYGRYSVWLLHMVVHGND